jgi:dephospho-CoA kinase
MKRVFLLYGNPGSGKSTLARKLRDEHGFRLISLDPLYVEFIQSECPRLYFEALGTWIAPHYKQLFNGKERTKQRYGRDLVQEWHEYILARIEDLIAQDDSVVVEGFLLFDCMEFLESSLSAKARVFRILADHLKYRILGPQMTSEEIAEFGLQADQASGR